MDSEKRHGDRTAWLNPVLVTVVAAAISVVVSLFILQGQTTARIDATRIEVLEGIDELEEDIEKLEELVNRVATSADILSNDIATVSAAVRVVAGRVDGMNGRIDRVLEILAPSKAFSPER